MKKYNLAIIIIAAIMLEASVAIQYYLTNYVINREVVKRAEMEIKEGERIAAVRAD